MTQAATQVATQAPVLVLTPPEVVTPVVAAQTTGAVKLPEDLKEKVKGQLDAFIAGLLQEDVRSDGFRTRLDQAFSLGRKEIADSTTLSNSFTKKNFVNETHTPAYKAISEMRALFDELNPARQGDLFAPNKVFGITIPFGNKLTGYLRRYESAEKQFEALHGHIIDAKDEVNKGVVELDMEQRKMWGALEKLEAAVYFISELDKRLTAEIEMMKVSDADRARALEQEVLYYVRQNVGDVQAAQALTINAYNVAGELRKTGREVMNGCDRVSTLGLAALSVAVTLARATGVQIKTMAMLAGAKQSVEDLIASTGTALQQHVQATTQFASDPMLGVKTLQNMFDQTNTAMDMMENFRTNALATMKTNNDMLGTQIAEQMRRLTNDRKAVGASDGIAL